MKQTTHLKASHGAMRLDTHRIMELEAEACAPEGGRMRQASAEADAPDLYAPAPRIPRDRPPAAGSVYWGVVIFSSVAFGFLIGWHVLASWGRA